MHDYAFYTRTSAIEFKNSAKEDKRLFGTADVVYGWWQITHVISVSLHSQKAKKHSAQRLKILWTVLCARFQDCTEKMYHIC